MRDYCSSVYSYFTQDSAKKLTEAHAKTDPSSESSISAGLTAIRRLTRSPSAQNSLETPKKKKTSSLKSPVAPQSGKKSLFQNVLKSNLQKALMQEQQQQQQMEEQGEEQQMESEEVAPMESPRKKMVASPKVSSPASRQASPAKAIVPLTTRPLASSSPSKTPLSPAKSEFSVDFFAKDFMIFLYFI